MNLPTLCTFVRILHSWDIVEASSPQLCSKPFCKGDAAGVMRVWDAEQCFLLREVSTGMACCAASAALGMRRHGLSENSRSHTCDVLRLSKSDASG